MGAGFLVMNGVPRVDNICNDMACYRMIKKDYLSRQCHNRQLIAARLLYKGAAYRQLGDLLRLPSDKAYNDILAYQAILEYYYYLDTGNNQNAIKALKKINDRQKLSRSIINYLQIELIYIKLINQIKYLKQISNEINCIGSEKFKLGKSSGQDGFAMIDILGKDLIKHGIKGDVHFERVKAAFDAYKELINGSRDRAGARLIEAVDYIRNMSCIYKGEKEFCIRQLKSLIRLLLR